MPTVLTAAVVIPLTAMTVLAKAIKNTRIRTLFFPRTTFLDNSDELWFLRRSATSAERLRDPSSSEVGWKGVRGKVTYVILCSSWLSLRCPSSSMGLRLLRLNPSAQMFRYPTMTSWIAMKRRERGLGHESSDKVKLCIQLPHRDDANYT